MPVYNALGEKICLMIVFKEKCGELPKKFRPVHGASTDVRASNNGWHQTHLVVEMVKKLPPLNGRPGLVVIDHYYGHVDKSTKAAIREKGYDVVYTAAACTAFTNPADITLNKPLKDRIRSAWHDKRGNDSTWSPDRQCLIGAVEESWNAMPSDTLAKGFLMAGISNAMDGTEDDWVWLDRPKN